MFELIISDEIKRNDVVSFLLGLIDSLLNKCEAGQIKHISLVEKGINDRLMWMGAKMVAIMLKLMV